MATTCSFSSNWESIDNIQLWESAPLLTMTTHPTLRGQKRSYFNLSVWQTLSSLGPWKRSSFVPAYSEGTVTQNRATILRYSKSDKARFFALNFTWSALSFVSNGELCISSLCSSPKSHNHRVSTKTRSNQSINYFGQDMQASPNFLHWEAVSENSRVKDWSSIIPPPQITLPLPWDKNRFMCDICWEPGFNFTKCLTSSYIRGK